MVTPSLARNGQSQQLLDHSIERPQWVDFCRSRQAEIGQKQPVRCAYETRTDSEVALLAIQYYDRKASEACTIVAGQELERFA